MRPGSGLCLAVAALALFVALPAAALARSSRRTNRRNDDRYRGPYRLIEGDRSDSKKQKQQEQEKRKQLLEEQKRQMEERQRQREEAIKRLEEMRKRALEAQKKAAQPTARKPQKAKTAGPPRGKKPGPGPEAQSAEEREQEAQKLLDEAFAQLQKGEADALLPAAQALRQVVAEYGETPAAVKAEAQLDLLLTSEPFGPIILLAEGEEMFAAQRYRCAQNKYRALLQRFPTSEQARKARQRLAEIADNDLLSKSVYTDEELEDARLWFLAGTIHLQNGRSKEAIAAFRKVAEEYPGSRYAAMAKEKLQVIRGS